MEKRTVTDAELIKFVDGRYNWRSMLPDDQLSIAEELLELRRLVRMLSDQRERYARID